MAAGKRLGPPPEERISACKTDLRAVRALMMVFLVGGN